MASQKPSLPYRVDYTPLGTSTNQTQYTGNGASAIKFATAQLKIASTHVTISHHDGEKWIPDTDSLAKAMRPIAGIGDHKAQAALYQLNEFTHVLAKQAGSRNGLDADVLTAWVQQFYRCAQMIGVTSTVMQQAQAQFQSKPTETAQKA